MEEARSDGASFTVAGCVVDVASTSIDGEVFTFTVTGSSTMTWRNILEKARYETVLMAEDAAISVHAFEDAAVAKTLWPTKEKIVSLDDVMDMEATDKALWIVLSIKVPHEVDPVFYSARELKRVPTTLTLESLPANPHLAGEMEFPVVPWRDTFSKKLCLRREDIPVLRLLTRHAIAGDNPAPMTLLGSPGCGRSSLVQTLALKLSHEDDKDVLYLHQVEPATIHVHFFSQSKTRVSGIAQDYSVVSIVQLLSVIEGRQLDPFIIADGFLEKELAWLAKYNLVVPLDGSIKASMSSTGILVPSWSVDQVLELVTHVSALTPVLIRERYARYGGDVASIFARDQEATARALHERIRRVGSNKAGTLQRYRVIDPNQEANFTTPSRWAGQLESLETLRASIDQNPLEWFEILLDRASVTPLHEDVYELTFQAWARKSKKIRLGSLTCKRWMEYPRAVEDRAPAPAWGRMLQVGRITLDTSQSILEGTTEDAAYDAIRRVVRGHATYWGPAYSGFLAVDAVARCTLQFKNNSPTTEAIALLRFTVGDRKEPSADMVRRVKRTLARYTKLPIIFIFVSPPGIDLSANGVPPDIPTFSATYECQSPFFYQSVQNTREVVRIVGEPF